MSTKPAQTTSMQNRPPAVRRGLSVWARLAALAALCLVALAVAPISPASAAFVWGDAHQLDFGQTISDMSCPTATQCTVVGGSNDETTFNPQMPGTVNAVPIASSGAYGSISCWSATQCTAVGDGDEVTFDPHSPGSTTHGTVDANMNADLVSVSCSAANRCSAVDGTSGNEVTFNPTSPTPATPITVDTQGNLRSVTCPGTTECVAVDNVGREATFDPTGVAPTFTQNVGLSNPQTGTPPSLNDVTCPNANQCSASTNNGSVSTFNPHNTSATARQFLSPATQHTGMACPTTGLCVTASANTGLVSFDPAAPSPTLATPLGVLGQGPIVCVSAIQCTASSGEGATTFDPVAPESTTEVGFTPAVTGISCPNATGCSFGDLGGNFRSVTPQSHSLFAEAVTGGSILAISCPDSAQCTTAQANGFLRTFDPGDIIGTPPLTYVTHSAQVTTIDCPTVTVCAVGESNGSATTFNPQPPGSRLSAFDLGGGHAIQGISCADDTHCVAVDATGAETPFNPQLPRNLAPMVVDPGIALIAVSCPIDAQCTAVDAAGQEVTFDPLTTTGGATPVSIDSGNGLGAISCPDATECVAVDNAGQSLTGNPQDAATPWDVEPIPGTSVLTGVSCPVEDQCSAVDSSGEYSFGSFVAVPVSSAPPTISGAAVVGQTLTETQAAWSGSPTAFEYQWEDCDANGLNCAPIANASNPSYTVAAGDAGDTIRIVETAFNAGGPGASATSDPTAVVPGPTITPSTAPAPPPLGAKHPPDAVEVKAALHTVLAPSGAGARIKALLKAGGYTFAFDAPSAGKLALDWYWLPRGARLPRARQARPPAKPVLVASVRARIRRTGEIKVKVKLSRAGRMRLRSTRRSLTLTGQSSFTPTGAKRTTRHRTFTIRR
jgi:hypothetical protein